MYAVLGEHQWLLASYPLQAQIDVWGDDPQAVASSSLAPRAMAERIAGGWRLSGQYSFSSGSTHARWAIIGAFLGSRAIQPASAICWCRSPTSRSSTIGTCSGLAGTGSRSLRLHDVFVPDHRCVLLSELLAGTPPGAAVHADYPLVRVPRGLMVNYSLPPVAIALGQSRACRVRCRACADACRAASTHMAASEFVQMTVAEAAAAIDAATLTMHSGRAAAEAMIAKAIRRSRRTMSCAPVAT